MSDQISPHFTLSELIFSDTAARAGIDNTPTPELIEHAKLYLIPGIEVVRNFLGKPVKINSGYRSVALNSIIPGSSNTSQHTLFEAADIVSPDYGTPLQIAHAIVNSDISFDQLIYEFGSWVHVSFSAHNKRQVLSKYTGTPYMSGIVDPKGKPL